MAFVKIVRELAFLALLLSGCVWLFSREEAARPGRLRAFHQDSASCESCHTPWRGVEEENCLLCHEFGDVSTLRPELRFHEANERCIACHVEHQGTSGKISRMDHTILHPSLACTQCHLDPHRQLFGDDCRACHGMITWRIDGYRHPKLGDRNCDKCHKPPLSHRDQGFWKQIEARHTERTGQEGGISPSDCWRCHVVHDWRHLLM
jgi:hypothetical protein